jgi:hypothetical protein
MTRLRVVSLVLAASLAFPVSAQPPQPADPNVKKKDLYRVAGGQRDGVSAFDRVVYAELKPEKEGTYDPRHSHT